jgi:type IV pilus assembly protein PilQ
MIKKIILLLLLTVTSVMADSSTEIVPSRDPFQEQAYNELFFIYYGNAESIAKLLRDETHTLLSSVGVVMPDKRTNSIWIEDTRENLQRINQFIRKIDIPVKQILIEAQIVNVDNTFMRNLGNEFVNNRSSGLHMDLPIKAMMPGHYAFTLAKLKSGVLIDMELSALESEGHAKIISRPQLITLNREVAYIEAGNEIPYQEKTAQGNTSIAFKKAVLGLKVTPEIVSENKILLKIILNQNKVSQIKVRDEPAISTREINTQVIVNDKQTIVLGGIYEESKDQVRERVPILGTIPLIGALFNYKHIANERKELLIFITPKIL